MGFLDNLLKKEKDEDGKSKKAGPSSSSSSGNGGAGAGGGNNTGGGIIPNLFGKQPRIFQGQGKSLGGSMPGTVLSISLPNPGPLGVRVEKRPNSEGTAIVNEVVPGSQAEAAGMKRGDVLCFAGSNGQDEMTYEMFLELAKSPERPLLLEVRRITTQSEKRVDPTSHSTTTKKSAEIDHRRQAVIAAAEARERAHKAKTKPIKQVTKTTLAREKRLQEQQQQQQASNSSSSDNYSLQPNDGPRSEEAKRAAEAAKLGEARLAQQLGYNPYEAARATAGQARTATTTAQHGTISAGSPAEHLPLVASRPDVMEPVREGNGGHGDGDDMEGLLPPPPIEFDEALATMASANINNSNNNSNNSNTVQSTCTIMKKLLVNATTKGQDLSKDDEESAAKFRKVRLANAKIKAALVDVEGAMDIMLLAGFVLDEQDGESVLLFPAGYAGPDWLPAALKRLDAFAASGN